MNQIDLSGRNAIVTGGARGIGYAISQRLLQSGAGVCIWDMDADAASEAVKELSERAGISDYLLSISHCRSHATAAAVAVGTERHSDRASGASDA